MRKLGRNHGLGCVLFRKIAVLVVFLEYFCAMKSSSIHPVSGMRHMASWTVICAAILLLNSCTQWTEEQKKRQSLPDFHFEAAAGGELKRSDLPVGKPATIVYFDPDCSHCKITMDNVVKHIDDFVGNTLVLISPADRTQVIPYLQEKKLLDHPGVLVGICTPQQFLDTFGTTATPTTLFYGGDFDLKMAYKGIVDEPGIANGLKAVAD